MKTKKQKKEKKRTHQGGREDRNLALFKALDHSYLL
jgi:hypothetical protein